MTRARDKAAFIPGQAATYDVGLTAGKLIEVAVGDKYPALDGSDITNLQGATLIRSGVLTNANLITHAHGQGTVPDIVWAEVKVTTSESSWAVGDVIKIYQMYEEDENDHGLYIFGSTTVLGLNQSGVDEVLRNNIKNNGTIGTFTDANVDIHLVGVWF